MTLNGVMAVTLRYFTKFGKPALQKTICGGIYARVYCIFSACTMLSQRKFTFAISSPVSRLLYQAVYGCSFIHFHLAGPKTTDFCKIAQRTPFNFKFIQDHNFCTKRKPLCHFLLVNNSNLHAVSHRFRDMADYWHNFLC